MTASDTLAEVVFSGLFQFRSTMAEIPAATVCRTRPTRRRSARVTRNGTRDLGLRGRTADTVELAPRESLDGEDRVFRS
jgi:hypothetical protein